MWESGAKVHASIIAILSKAWPYIKLLSMLFMWYIPGHREAQGAASGGSTSSVNGLFCRSLFHGHYYTSFKLESNMKAFNTPMKIGVEVASGFYVFMFAAVLSLLVTDIMVWLLMYDTDSSADAEYMSLLDDTATQRERSDTKTRGGAKRSVVFAELSGSETTRLVHMAVVSTVCVATSAFGIYGAF